MTLEEDYAEVVHPYVQEWATPTPCVATVCYSKEGNTEHIELV